MVNKTVSHANAPFSNANFWCGPAKPPQAPTNHVPPPVSGGGGSVGAFPVLNEAEVKELSTRATSLNRQVPEQGQADYALRHSVAALHEAPVSNVSSPPQLT